MAEMAWTVYWNYGMTDYYTVPPGDSPKDPHDVLQAIIPAEGYENGYDEKAAERCAKSFTDWHRGE